MKKTYAFSAIFLIIFKLQGQVIISSLGSVYTVDFTGYAGSGLQPGYVDGYLSSDEWSLTGMGDGDSDFGATSTTGDFARGTTTGGIITGGLYALDTLGNQALMIQPTTDDFTPGSIILKLINSTGSDIGQLDIAYTLYILNDQNRANNFNLSFSYDNITYIDIPDVNYTSAEAADFISISQLESTTISGIVIANGNAFYLRWSGDDVSGTGSRDEFALDDISITAAEAVPTPVLTFSTGSEAVNETDPSASVIVNVSSTTDCTFTIDVSAASTATDGDDYSNTLPSPLIFLTGEAITALLSIPILDDAIDEPDETVILNLNILSGTCILGTPSTLTITILDDDDPVITTADIADVTTEDAGGNAISIGNTYSLTGIVYGVNLSDAGLQFTLIDNTGGIAVFSFANDFGYSATEGDEINVIGTISQFNGLTQIEPDTVILVSTGNILKTPTSVTAINEATESDLIKFNDLLQPVDVTQWLGDGTSFNVDYVSTSGDTITVRIDNNTELSAIPPFLSETSLYQITGLGSQYDPSMPYTAGYEIYPRYISDISILEDIRGINNSQINIYPNPATEYLILNGKEKIETAEIINQLGQMINTMTINSFEKTIDIKNIPSGFYYIKIKTASGIFSSEFSRQ